MWALIAIICVRIRVRQREMEHRQRRRCYVDGAGSDAAIRHGMLAVARSWKR